MAQNKAIQLYSIIYDGNNDNLFMFFKTKERRKNGHDSHFVQFRLTRSWVYSYVTKFTVHILLC